MRSEGSGRARRVCAAAAACAAALGLAMWAQGGPARAEGRDAPESALEQSDALLSLFELARKKEGDPHLPFVLNNLKRAISAHDMVAFLDLIDPEHFDAQFKPQVAAGRGRGEALGRYVCEFLSVCDVSKTYGFRDVVSAHVLSVSPEGGLTGGLVEVSLELRLWDGLTVVSTIFYNPANARLSAAVG